MENENQTKLTIYGEGIKVLPKLPLKLISLTVPNNNLSSLPKLPETLRYLNINNNLFTKLPKLPTSLQILKCNKNFLGEVPYISENLKHLECNRNDIFKFSGVSPKNNYMKHLDISENYISHLPKLPENIGYFDCSRNQIESYVNFPKVCSTFITKTNLFYPGYLTKVPERCQKLDCSDTPVQIIPKLPNTLEYINLGNCEITNVNKKTFLNLIELSFLNLYGNELSSEVKLELSKLKKLKYFCTNKTKFDIPITKSVLYRKEKVNFTILKKGTVMFRGLSTPNLESDFLGPFKDGKFYCYPNFYVYFYPYPFVSDTIYDFKHMVMYYLTTDVEVVLGVLPSMNMRVDRYKDKYLYTCSERELSSEFKGRDYDACFDEKFLSKYPSNSGMVTISPTDGKAHVDFYLSSRYIQVSKFFHFNQTNEGDIGVTEFMLHPLRKRNSKEIVIESENPYDYISKNENLYNYKPFYTTQHKQFSADQLYTDVMKMLSPEGFVLDGNLCHLTIDPQTKFMMYYEESNKKDLIPLSETNKIKYL